jgi:murein DD-endopeptidase MepM/ murein hydrolase activator NlpD
MKRAVLIVIVGACGDPHVLSGYQSPMGANGKFRHAGHSGVDFGGNDGDPVLAAAYGRVEAVRTNDIAGTCVLLRHECRGCTLETFFTSYCHLQRSLVKVGELVVRGKQIAELGHSGKGAGGVPHVHFSLCTHACSTGTGNGELQGTLDPAHYDAGCFVPSKSYAVIDSPVLTHPIRCSRH